MPTALSKKTALKFVLLLGIVSFFADMTYEGARSISGPYLAILGANALIVSFVSGFGELLGYSLRLISGYLADNTRKYWAITIVGYLFNLLAVPLLALAGQWWLAAALLVLERAGKAIRTPARDAMLSHAGSQVGMGWGFGLHEALDQHGAMLGPLIVAAVLYFHGSYQLSFAVLLVPAIFALLTLFLARHFYPNPQQLAAQKDNLKIKKIQGKAFWFYLAGACLIAAGYADFPLIAFHFQKMSILPKVWVPIAYSIAMGIDGLTALLCGHLYDRHGFIILIIVTLISSLFAPLVFFAGPALAMLGVTLWSIGVGAHQSLMRAIIANMVPADKRASAYGVFNMGYGISWFLGSIMLGLLYDFSIPLLVAFSLAVQLAAVPLLLLAR